MRTDLVITENWQLTDLSGWADAGSVSSGEAEGGTWYATSVPSGVHEVLLREGVITDPHIGRQAAEADWVSDHDWAFRTSFASPNQPAGAARLIFRGVDTLAEVYLNGEHLVDLDDMFRERVVDVSDLLAPAGQPNRLVVVIGSPTRFVDDVVIPDELAAHVKPQHFMRKGGGDWSNYLGARPRMVKLGIPRDVVLSLTDPTWIDDVRVQTTLADGRAEVAVEVSCGGAATGRLDWRLTAPDGSAVDQGSREVGDGGWRIPVTEPELWWPRGHGEQALYRLVVDLHDADAQVDSTEISVGIREVELRTTVAGTDEPCFELVVNGQTIMARGANWAQVEGITNVWISERAQRLLDLVEHADMNILRVWGGGIIPEPEFYDECDRRGLLVWQDFMFEYGMYPTDLAEFAARVEPELVDVVRRLRNHPCIALWCGGNENHMGWDFQFHTPPAMGTALFEEVMPRIVSEHDGTRPFHPSSPFGGPQANWPRTGDWHDYTTLTYCHQGAVPTFVSEMGRVSTPSLRSMQRFLSPEELWPADHDATITQPGTPSWPPMWGYRAPDGAWGKIGPIEQYLEPRDAAGYVRVLGTAHGEYLQTSVERHRRGRPDGAGPGRRRNGGDIVWRLNDPWPIVYWSVIDSYLEPKVAYYYLRRAYAPVLVSFERTAESLHVWVTNDSAEPVVGDLRVARTTFSGKVVGELTLAVAVAPGASIQVTDTAALGPIVLRSEFLVAELNGHPTSFLLIGERYLELQPAALTVQVDGTEVVVSTDTFTRQVVLEWDDALDGVRVEDSYFDLMPGQTRRITLLDLPAAPGRITVSAVNAEPVVVDIVPPHGPGDSSRQHIPSVNEEGAQGR